MLTLFRLTNIVMKLIWQAGPPCLFWMVCKIRNGTAFMDDLLSIEKLKTTFVSLYYRRRLKRI